ncbi:MAG: endolytic transglycosylase MltG [Trueperaceae bacterium]|nr:endolytic transglycosylase MltG [Trueperaceae bacterium]
MLTAAIALAGAWTTWRLSAPDPNATATKTLEVLPGWGAARIADELEATGVVRDGTVFALYLRARGFDRRIGEGLYDLAPGVSAAEVARRLVEGGRPRTSRVVVPEGLRAGEVAVRLDEAGVADADEVMGRIADPGALAPPWLPDGASLEGYLFPDTYEFHRGGDVAEALRTMVDHFAARLDDATRARLQEADLTVHAWTTLASMVQAEAAGPTEMPIIAGVFLNRLEAGMPLQSDPTVAYGLDKRLPELSAVDGDLRVDHPWNTYTRTGLPRGPIGNPGADALSSVLAPVRTHESGAPWLYFLHGTDGGTPVFRPNTSLPAHERDVDRYLR